MYIKKITIVFLSIYFVFMLNTPIIADAGFKIKLDNVSAKTGEEFKINLLLENNPGVAGITLKLKFDKNVIKPISFENKNSKFTSLSNINSDGIDLNSIDTIYVTFDSENNVIADGIIGTFTFFVLDNTDISSSSIELIGNKGDIFNSALNDVEFSTTEGIITLKNPNIIYGDVDTDNKLTVNDAAMILKKVLDNSSKMDIEVKEANYMKYADVDTNGILTAADAAIILKKVLDNNFTMPVESSNIVLIK